MSLDDIETLACERRAAVVAAGGDTATADWAAIAVSTGDVLALLGVVRAMEEIARDYHCVYVAQDPPPEDWDGTPDPDVGKHLEGCVGCFAQEVLDSAPKK